MSKYKKYLLNTFLLLAIFISCSKFSFAQATGKIKVYANVMKEQNYPITFKIYEEDGETLFKEYVLDESNDWKVEDSIPTGNYEVKASMERNSDFEFIKYPFERKMEVKENQQATSLDDGVFTILQVEKRSLDEFRVLLAYQDEDGNFKSGEHTKEEAMALQEELLKRQSEGTIRLYNEDPDEADRKVKESDKYFDERIEKLNNGIDPDKEDKRKSDDSTENLEKADNNDDNTENKQNDDSKYITSVDEKNTEKTFNIEESNDLEDDYTDLEDKKDKGSSVVKIVIIVSLAILVILALYYLFIFKRKKLN